MNILIYWVMKYWYCHQRLSVHVFKVTVNNINTLAFKTLIPPKNTKYSNVEKIRRLSLLDFFHAFSPGKFSFQSFSISRYLSLRKYIIFIFYLMIFNFNLIIFNFYLMIFNFKLILFNFYLMIFNFNLKYSILI